MLQETNRSPDDPRPVLRRVTVYAASSDAIDTHYFEAASRVGRALATAGLQIVYGGGSTGLMGALADAALAAGGEVHGVTPAFLKEMEVSHEGLTSLRVVDDMRSRKHLMLAGSDAVVTLPGGCGTYEEVFEALTLKRLGRWNGPIVLVNTGGFYDRLQAFLEHSIEQRFMDSVHADMWQVVSQPEQVVPALQTAAHWGEDALAMATVKADG